METRQDSEITPVQPPNSSMPTGTLPNDQAFDESYDVAYADPTLQSLVTTPTPIFPTVPLKFPLRTLLGAFGLGVLADFLFYGKPLGISVLIFTGCTLLLMIFLGKMERVRSNGIILLLLVPMGFFATMVALHTNQLLAFLNLVAVICLFLLVVYFYVVGDLSRLSVWGYPLVGLIVLTKAFVYTFPVSREATTKLSKAKGATRWLKPVLRGLLITAPIFLVFLTLLSMADGFFADSVNNLFRFDNGFNFGEIFNRVLLILAITWALCGSFAYAFVRHLGKGNGTALPENLPGTLVPNPLIGFTELVIIIGSINLLFAGFAAIQFEYLFSGKALNSLDYEAYRFYIHRGFGELLFTASLVIIFILGLRWLARHDKRWQKLAFNILATITVVLALVMVAAAFYRMVVWEEVEYYIVTQLRDYVRSFILWLGLTFGWLLLTLWIRKVRFAIGFFMALLGFLLTVNIIISDGNTALANIERYKASVNTDLAYRYLYTYSDDAVPALISSLDKTEDAVRWHICNNLVWRYKRLAEDKSWQNWTSFNWSRWQAFQMLENLKKEGKLNENSPGSNVDNCSVRP
jgi:hypothetical protein